MGNEKTEFRRTRLDYWIDRGTICWNYCEDTQIILDQEWPQGTVAIPRPDRLDLGVFDLTPLIRTLFPGRVRHSDVPRNAMDSEINEGTSNANYLMHLMLRPHMDTLKYNGSTLKILTENCYLRSATALYVAVVLEMDSEGFLINQDLLTNISRLLAPDPVLDIVMSEVYLHPESIYDILLLVNRMSAPHELLRDGEWRNHETRWSGFYRPCMQILYQCIDKSNLLDVMFTYWDAGSENTVSVLQNLCEIYAFFATTNYLPIEQ
jgi:hypothetical protein